MKSFPRYLYISLLLLALLSAAVPMTRIGGTNVYAQGETKRYVIVYHQQSSIPKTADDRVSRMGGQIVTRMDEVGAVVATSSNPNFAAELANSDSSISDISLDVEVKMIPTPDEMKLGAMGDGPVEAPGDDTQTGSEPFYRFQWDKKRMRASNQGSYTVQQGRRDVVVAVLDTGADILPVPHQDIAPNLDFARSRSFIGVVPPGGNPNPAAWDDKNGHGSWCLSAVGAPINARGISGVAPRVTLVALKVLGDNGSGSYPALAQALIYAGINKFDVASMSLGGYLNRSDQSQHALIKLVQRAVNFARENGVTPIAALGNESFNLSDGNFMQSFMEIPGEIDGVIGVSATGYFNLKASYSNYGMGKTDISAPGGDFAVQATSQTNPLGGGSVLGAWAQEVFGPNAYAFASGTSMACPNAAGVCALIVSQFGDFTADNGRKAHMSPQRVEAYLQQTANNQPCPDPDVVNFVTVFPVGTLPAGSPVGEPNQRCQGEAGYNNFYGKGIVDAFKAVTEAPGQ
ncbi:MAG TPA: S8 family serine peptidase [Pyrinomonadaceae bacterium]|jgi:subtilisin family serine protease|nr:S8 family serine peptidase [Pyrinomonadaceae bacterium]